MRWPSVRPRYAASPNRRCAPVPPIPSCCCWRRSPPWPRVQPERALAVLKRYQKRFAPGKPTILLTALALAQQRQFSRARTMLEAEGLESFPAAARWFVGDDVMQDWLRDRLLEIRLERVRTQVARPGADHTPSRQADRDPGAPRPAAGSARSAGNTGTAALGG